MSRKDKFGWKNGTKVPEQQAIIKEIQELEQAHMSHAAIARDLNERNVPTQRGSKWHASTIANVLRDNPGPLIDAINRTGSTDPEKIRAALAQTDMKPEQLIMGYQGVKFDDTGQNILAGTYLIQLQGKSYQLVWPEHAARVQLQWPMSGSLP